jgi:NTE family protein
MSDTPANAEPFDTSELLRDVPLFRHLDARALAELEGELEWFAMPGGAVLFEYGDESDALYVLKSGSLAHSSPTSTDSSSSTAWSRPAKRSESSA